MRMRFAAALCLALIGCSRSHGPALHDDPQALAYRSRSKVSDASAVRMAAEAVGDARKRPAWSEPNHVHAADGPFGNGADKYVYGEARLFLVEYETDPGKFREVDAKDDAVMAYADALFTVGQLERWSKESGAEFDVQLGRMRGQVHKDGPDDDARKLLDALAAKAGGLAPAAAEAQRPLLDAKYRDRR